MALILSQIYIMNLGGRVGKQKPFFVDATLSHPPSSPPPFSPSPSLLLVWDRTCLLMCLCSTLLAASVVINGGRCFINVHITCRGRLARSGRVHRFFSCWGRRRRRLKLAAGNRRPIAFPGAVYVVSVPLSLASFPSSR